MKCKLFVLLLLLGVAGNVMSYTPGDILLMKCREGSTTPEEICWGQSRNSELGCSPSYNYHISDYASEGEDCHHLVAGCAAIAFGQIMAMWQFPIKSTYRTYNWNKIPPYLKDGDPEDCPLLIKDVGRACGTHYTAAGFNVDGSWTTRHDLRDGIEKMGYYVSTCTEKDWLKYNTLENWYDLIRNEIDCGRPVIMFGKDGNVFNSHYFVIDGYSANDPYLFHINPGHNNGGSFMDIRNYKYTDDREIFYGIYPKVGNAPKISYSLERKFIIADCPASYFGTVQYKVENADSWECIVYDRVGTVFCRRGGAVKDGIATIWDGWAPRALPQDNYWMDIIFKNSNGAYKSFTTHISYVRDHRVERIEAELLNSDYSPNCQDGINDAIEIKTDNARRYSASIYNAGNNIATWSGSGTVDTKNRIIKIKPYLGDDGSYLYTLKLDLEGGCNCSSSTTAYFTIFYDNSKCGELSESSNILSSENIIKITNFSDLLEISSIEPLTKISVYLISGMCVAQENCSGYIHNIDISKIQKNLLIVVVQTENGVYSKKILIE